METKRGFGRAGIRLSAADLRRVRRGILLRAAGTSAFRLLHGDGDGLSGFTVDAWGDYLLVAAQGAGPAQWAEALERGLVERLRPRGIVRKDIFTEEPLPGRPAARLERGKVEERVVQGERPPERLVVLENGIPFWVRLLGARHTGLFTDMREERRRLEGIASGLRVLNTFAYTGGFSVAAARGGAAEVVSVDAVGKVLEWARENFRLAGLDPDRHRFVRMDVLRYLEQARRRGWTFDAIVLDPPPFAAFQGRLWSLRRDYPDLIRRSLSVLGPGGYLWVCANAAGVHGEEVERWISAASAAAGRALKTVARAGQPADYPAPSGFPRYHYLKIHVLRG